MCFFCLILSLILQLQTENVSENCIFVQILGIISAKQSRLDWNLNIFSNRLDVQGALEFWNLIEIMLL